MKPKTHNLIVRVDEDTILALEECAAAVGESVSTIVRMALRESLKQDGFLPRKEGVPSGRR